MRVMVLLLAASVAAACGDAAANRAAPPADPPAGQLPEGAFIFGATHIEAMLHQCSRQTPAAGEGNWQPSAADIVALEAALPEALAKHPFPNLDWSHWPRGWRRQYVGIVRDGRRFVYGNFVPANADYGHQAATSPLVICDGGPVFFGAEYDVDARTFTQIAFNGAI